MFYFSESSMDEFHRWRFNQNVCLSDIAKNHLGRGGYRQNFDSWNTGADVFIWSLHFGVGKSIYSYIYILYPGP